MSGLDSFAFLNRDLRSGYVGAYKQYRPPKLAGFSSWGLSRPAPSLWGQMSSGSVNKPDPFKQAVPPEKFNVNLPASTQPPGAPKAPWETPYWQTPGVAAAPAPSTKGDPLASIGAAVGSSLSHLNLANAIPYFMERVHVAAGQLADANVPVASQVGFGVHGATGLFLDGVQAASDALAPVLDYLPNHYRDSQLADRAWLYRKIVTGEDVGLFDPVFKSGNILPGSSPGVNALTQNYANFRQQLARSLPASPEGRGAEFAIRLLRESIDLPQSVKDAIDADPNGDLNKYLDAAPEGRQFSYDHGVSGAISNLGYPLFFYGTEAMGASATVGGLRGALVGKVPGAVGVNSIAGGLGSRLPLASRAIQTGVAAGSKAWTIAARLQKYSVAAGIGYQAASTVMDGVARYYGDQAAIDWFDKVNRTTRISDDPRVQLVTSFSVNPLEALRLAKKGTVRLASGVGDVTVGRWLGVRFTRYYTHTTLMAEQVRQMYRLGSVAEAEAFIAKHYDSKGEAFDEVVGVSLDHVLNELPADERIAFNARFPDPVARTKAGLRLYGTQTMDALTNHADLVAKRWNEHSWEYHQYPGEFSAEIARLNSRDMFGAMRRTFEFRARNDAVVGYTEYVPPRGQAIISDWIDRVSTDGRINVEGVNGVQDLIRQFPAMRKYWQGLIPGGAKSVPRANVEEMLRLATADHALEAKQHPIRATTGADPVIRPDSPTLDRDYADAIGTDVATVKAIAEHKFGGKDNPTGTELMRTLLTSKTDLDPATALTLTPDQVWEQASQYLDEHTAPFVELGNRLVAAEKRLAGVRSELVRLASIPENARGAAHSDTQIRLQREMDDIQRLVRTASDPLTPFSAEVRLRGAAERTSNRIKGMDPANLSKADEAYLRRFLDSTPHVGGAGDLRGADLHEAALEAIPDAGTNTARDAHLAEMAARKVDALGVLRELDAIDGQAESMITSVSGLPWTELLRKTPEGSWGWSGGTMATTRAMRTRLADYLRGQGGRGRALANGINEIGDAEVWDLLSRYPGAMERMTASQRRFIQAARANMPAKTGMDEYADAWMKANDKSSGAFLDELSALRDNRDELLSGRLESNLRRTGDISVPPVYVAEAEMAAGGRELYYDAEFDSVIHPANVAQVADILARPQELYTALREAVNGDPILKGQVEGIANETGIPVADLLRDPVYADKLKAVLIPADFEAPIPGFIAEATPLDFSIRAGDAGAVRQLSDQLSEGQTAPAPPLTGVPLSEAQSISAGATRNGAPIRASTRFRAELTELGADLTALADDAIQSAPENQLGTDVLSVLNHGITGTKVATTNGVLSLLREIENGNAGRMGIGPGLQAEGQRVANLLIKEARNQARREGIEVGVYMKGEDPAMMAEYDLQLARTLEGTIDPNTGRPKKGGVPVVTYDPADPLGTLQYGLKKRPADAVVLEWGQVPGLSEEFLAGHFEPWHERVWTAQTRHAFNWVFGKYGNATIRAATRQRFVERAQAQGVAPEVSSQIWERWQRFAAESRSSVLQKIGLRRTYHPGDNALYAGPTNIPNSELDAVVHGRYDRPPGVLDTMLDRGELTIAERNALGAVNYSTLFREASSFTRRTLRDRQIELGGRKTPQLKHTESLGQGLAAAYGLVAHNKAVTTMYYWFRFGLDVRFHAMNYLESQLLYLGRAGLKKGEIDEGLFGNTAAYLRKLDEDPMNNTGYAQGRSRMAMAVRTFNKEQPDMLRAMLKGMETEDPQLMEQALREIAAGDGELKHTIALMGDNVDIYIAKMDAWHAKMLRSVDETEAAATIDEAVASAAAGDPAMAEVYSRIAQANKDLWADIHNTFYGNAERSRAERFLNSYLLFWPLSYQLKASKWLLRVLFDRAGGLKTNAAGAYVLNGMIASHNQLLATDPEYRDWYEKHKTLTFVASMLMPITWDSMGTSLSPVLRDLFFNAHKGVADVGPIYTFTKVLPPLLKEVYVDLYPSLKDMPFFNELYSMTGQKPPKAPVDKLGGQAAGFVGATPSVPSPAPGPPPTPGTPSLGTSAAPPPLAPPSIGREMFNPDVQLDPSQIEDIRIPTAAAEQVRQFLKSIGVKDQRYQMPDHGTNQKE